MTDAIAKPVTVVATPKGVKVESGSPAVKASEVKKASKEGTAKANAGVAKEGAQSTPKKSKKKKRAAKSPEPGVSLAVEAPKAEAPKAPIAEPAAEVKKEITPEPVLKDSPKTEEPVVESSDPVKKEDDAEPIPSSPTKPSPVKIDEDGTITIGNVEAKTQEEKAPEPVEESTKEEESATEPEVKSEVEVAKHLEKEIDKVIEQVSVPNEPVQKPDALSVAHQESLTQIHQKLDSLIASESTAKAAIVEPTPVVTPDALEKIHLKLDALANSDAVKSAALQAEKAIEMVAQIDLEKLHAKLDKMAESLAITPKADEGLVHVHQKMETIHEAILANAKSAPVEAVPEPVTEKVDVASAEKLEALNQKFETMQAAIDKLTEALTQKLTSESTLAPVAEEPQEPTKAVVPATTEAVVKAAPTVKAVPEVKAVPAVEAAPKVAASPPKVAASPPKVAASPPKVAASPPKAAASPPKAATTPPKVAAAPVPQITKPASETKSADLSPVDSKKSAAGGSTSSKKDKHAKRSSFFGGLFGS